MIPYLYLIFYLYFNGITEQTLRDILYYAGEAAAVDRLLSVSI